MAKEAVKHTPGPWKYDGTRIMRERAGDSPYHQAIASIVLVCRPGKEVFANGNLIAAAPELAEQASLLVRTIWDTFRHRGQESQWEALEECTKDMVKILAKAEGK